MEDLHGEKTIWLKNDIIKILNDKKEQKYGAI